MRPVGSAQKPFKGFQSINFLPERQEIKIVFERHTVSRDTYVVVLRPKRPDAHLFGVLQLLAERYKKNPTDASRPGKVLVELLEKRGYGRIDVVRLYKDIRQCVTSLRGLVRRRQLRSSIEGLSNKEREQILEGERVRKKELSRERRDDPFDCSLVELRRYAKTNERIIQEPKFTLHPHADLHEALLTHTDLGDDPDFDECAVCHYRFGNEELEIDPDIISIEGDSGRTIHQEQARPFSPYDLALQLDTQKRTHQTVSPFRKEGPMWIDYEIGQFIAPHTRFEEALNKLLATGELLILGSAASGKTTLLRHLGYTILNRGLAKRVLYINPRAPLPIPRSLNELAPTSDDVVLIEDAHEELIGEFVALLQAANSANQIKALGITARDPRRNPASLAGTEGDPLRGLYEEAVELEPEHEVFVGRAAQTLNADCGKLTQDLDSHLPGWRTDAFIAAFGLFLVQTRGRIDAEEVTREVTARVTTLHLGKSRVLGAERAIVPVGLLYQFDIPVTRQFLERELETDRNIIDLLIERGELIILPGASERVVLSHPSIARLYAEYYGHQAKEGLLEGVPTQVYQHLAERRTYDERLGWLIGYYLQRIATDQIQFARSLMYLVIHVLERGQEPVLVHVLNTPTPNGPLANGLSSRARSHILDFLWDGAPHQTKAFMEFQKRITPVIEAITGPLVPALSLHLYEGKDEDYREFLSKVEEYLHLILPYGLLHPRIAECAKWALFSTLSMAATKLRLEEHLPVDALLGLIKGVVHSSPQTLAWLIKVIKGVTLIECLRGIKDIHVRAFVLPLLELTYEQALGIEGALESQKQVRDDAEIEAEVNAARRSMLLQEMRETYRSELKALEQECSPDALRQVEALIDGTDWLSICANPLSHPLAEYSLKLPEQYTPRLDRMLYALCFAHRYVFSGFADLGNHFPSQATVDRWNSFVVRTHWTVYAAKVLNVIQDHYPIRQPDQAQSCACIDYLKTAVPSDCGAEDACRYLAALNVAAQCGACSCNTSVVMQMQKWAREVWSPLLSESTQRWWNL